jgi:hypothetical protein
LAGKKKIIRGAPRIRKGAKLQEPEWTGYEKLTGEEFHRKKQGSHSWYYANFAFKDLMPAVWIWMEANGFSKDEIKKAKAADDTTISNTAAITCQMLNAGMPDFYKPAAEYWESLPGTMGELRPVSEFIRTRIAMALNEGVHKAEQKEKEDAEDAKKAEIKEKYTPSIQDRIRLATYDMCEFIEAAHDDFLEGKISDFKDIKPATQLRRMECKQPHARIIKASYDCTVKEYDELLNPPKLGKNATDLEKDYAQQLKEGYAHLSKSQLKKIYAFYIAVQGACDAIIAESKANRKPRKISRKSPEQLVSKLKYKITDDKYSISSIPSWKLIGASCLVTFNGKTRKLGIYYTSNEDPLGSMRDGTGLDLKGTTLQRFDENKSVACTLRKPVEQLREVKSLNTRKKFENWFAKLTTTPIKMNGRINAETVLIAAY